MAQSTVVQRPVRRMLSPLVVAGVFAVTVAARLVPLLRGGGLRGYGSYDDSVYFAAALGWVHGRWPYRDFLLLQPPGLVVALSPFAALGHWFGDSGGLAVARLAWMLLGGLTAAGLVALLWRTSRSAAVVAGLFYALFWPASMVERVTDLEGPQNFLLVTALVLLQPFRPPRASWRARRLAALTAGVALGLALSIKIWEIAPIIVLAGWLAWKRDRRESGRLGVGVITAVTAVCLPFFLVAPRQMWTMVVADQLNRPWHAGWAKRLVDSTGTSHLLPTSRPGAGLVIVLLIIAIVVVLACRRPGARLVAALFGVEFGTLLKAPPTYVHYGAFIAPSLAILLGVATAEAVDLMGQLGSMTVRRLGGGLVTVGVGAVLVLLASGQAAARVDAPPPKARFVAAARAVRGCISYDEPSQALSMDVVSHDLHLGCPFIVDLGATTHWSHMRVERHGHPTHAERVGLRYLRSGSASLLYRYPPAWHAGRPANIIGRWSLVARDHRLRLVKPGPRGTRRT